MRRGKSNFSFLWKSGRKETTTGECYSRHPLHGSSPELSPRTASPEVESILSTRSEASPYGLSLLYSSPFLCPSVDLIFIHGLRGDRVWTWCYGDPDETFWLQRWLPSQPEFRTARIWTFGYDSDWLTIKARNISDLECFGHSLLLEMKQAADLHPGEWRFPIGKIPLAFVSHSMGGLVAKSACVLGQQDESYQEIVRAICGMVFMATPHGGSELARSLKRVLRVVGILSFKEYIRELVPGSETLEDLNRRFRSFAEELEIVSLCERLPTWIGPVRLGIIVTEPASILGYAKEKQISMMADHRGICRFPNEDNYRYVTIRSRISDLFKGSNEDAPSERDPLERDQLKLVQRLLGISSAPLDDHIRASGARISLFCRWILEVDCMKAWLEDNTCQARVVLIYGQSGSGRTVLSSFLIDRLRDNKKNCQFFYFRLDQVSKRSPSTMLRSLAYQAACQISDFRACLASIAQDELDFSNATVDFLWEKIFIGILFHKIQNHPLYWVIDGLDESTAPSVLPGLLASTRLANLPLRIAIFSLPVLSTYFARLSSTITVDEISLDVRNQGLQEFVSHNLEGSRAAKEETLGNFLPRLFQSIGGNFLCIQHVVKILHNQSIISPSDLVDIPEDIQGLYLQMAHRLSMSWQGNDEFLARTFLTWTFCGLRPMSLDEFQAILALTEVGKMCVKDLKNAIPRVCGGFVKIEANFHVHMAHDTAHHFLTEVGDHPLCIDSLTVHTQIFESCMYVLSKLTRPAPGQRQVYDPLTMYASVSWHAHLEKIAYSRADNIFPFLVSFLCGPSAISWIHHVALHGQISTLADASNRLATYLTCLKNTTKEMTADSERRELIADLLQWSVDLRNLTSHYGSRLTQMPEAVYELIPPFCPTGSSIQKYAASVRRTSLVVEGLQNREWTDLGARFGITKHDNLREVLCGGRYFITASTGLNGYLYVFDISTNQKLQEVVNGEPILGVSLSHAGNNIAVYGPRNTKIWDITRSCHTVSVPNPVGYGIMALGFTIDDKVLFACLENGMVQRIFLDNVNPAWEATQALGKQRADCGFPTCASFNANCSLLAIAYDEGPVAILSITSNGFSDEWTRSSFKQEIKNPNSIKFLSWDAFSWSLLGVYQNGCVFKWCSHDGEVKYLDDQVTGLACGPDGRFFVTSHADGKLKVRKQEDFSLIQRFSERSVAVAVTISRDGQKVFDVRESHCNVWHIILQQNQTPFEDSKASPQPSSGNMQPTRPTYTESVSYDQLATALAFSKETGIYVAGYGSGAIRAFARWGRLLTSLDASDLSVTHAVWSEEKSYLATADIGTTVQLRSFDCRLNKFNFLFQVRTGEKVVQLLFNHKSNLLLTVGPTYLSVLSLDSGKTLVKISMSNTRKKWINHPHCEEFLLCFDSNQMKVLAWRTLATIETRTFRWLLPSAEDKDGSRVQETDFGVKNIWTTADMEVLILHLSLSQPRRSEMNVVVAVPFHDAERHGKNALLGHALIPHEQIQHTFGIFQRSRQSEKSAIRAGSKTEKRLVFLDQDDWVCSVSLTALPRASHSERHFLLPTAWTCAENMHISQVLLDGTCLCPVEDNIAVLRNGLK